MNNSIKNNITVDVLMSEECETISVVVNRIEIDEEYVNVFHDSEEALYYCEGFEEAISDEIGFEVKFTEYMGQDSFVSRLEAV